MSAVPLPMSVIAFAISGWLLGRVDPTRFDAGHIGEDRQMASGAAPGWNALGSSTAPDGAGRPGEVAVANTTDAGPAMIGGGEMSRIFIVVDLPDPFGPRNPVDAPGWPVKDTSSTTVLRPYRLVT